MPRPLDATPKEGEYFTGKDVEVILPKSTKPAASPPDPPLNRRPITKDQQGVWDRHAERKNISTFNPTDSPVPKPRESLQPAMRAYSTKLKAEKPQADAVAEAEKEAAEAKLNKEKLTRIPAIMRPFLSPSLKRSEGRPSTIWTFKVVTAAGEKVTGKFEDFHIIVCWYQFLVGALGGVVVGIETDYFATHRFPTPNVPVPSGLKLAQEVAQQGVQSSAAAYRFAKRAVVAGLVFDCLEKNVEEYRGKKDWVNMGFSGVITGGIFGLRGGYRGASNGAMVFGGFAALAGILYQYKKKVRQN